MSDWSEKGGWRRRPYSIFGPLLLIAVGGVLLLKTLGIIEGDLWALFLTVWPILFIVSGMDSLYRGDSFVGGVVWTGLGVILLLGNLGYLQIAPWHIILRLWPFLLIVWGLDILFHSRRWWSALSGILVGFILLAVMFWMIVLSPAAPARDTETFQTGLEGAEKAAINVESITGNLWVGTGAESGYLVEGEIDRLQNGQIERSYTVQDGNGNFQLVSENSFVFTGTEISKNWRLALNSRLPLDVTTRMIVGNQTANLTGLQIDEIFLETIIGKTEIYLPTGGAGEIEASVIMGELVIYVMPGTAVEIEVDTGLTAVQYPDDFIREDDIIVSPSFVDGEEALRLRVNQPVGSLRIRYVQQP